VGRLTATVTLNPVSQDGNLPGATRSGSVWTSLWLVLAVLLVLAVAITLLVWRLRRRSAGRSRPRPPHQKTRRPLQSVH